MAKIICRICLRTDMQTRDIDEKLIDFYDELTDYTMYENASLKYCSICEHLLAKFYNFKRKCKKANKILKSFKKGKHGGYPNNIHEELPPISLGLSDLRNMKQINMIYNNLEPLLVQTFIKQEAELENVLELESIDTLTTNVTVEENFLHTDKYGNQSFVKIHDNIPEENVNLITQPTPSETPFKEEEVLMKVEEESGDLQNAFNGDSDTELINENKDQIQANHKKTRVRKRDFKVLQWINDNQSTDYVEENTAQLIEKSGNVEEIINYAKEGNKTGETSQLGQNNTEAGSKETSEQVIKITDNAEKTTKQLNEKTDRKQLKEKTDNVHEININYVKEGNTTGETSESRKIKKEPRPKKTLNNQTELEKVFEIQLFATVEEAKAELKSRRTSEPYLSAEHKCEICYTVFRHAKLVDYHMRWHSSTAGEHVCAICDMRFEIRRTLTEHKRRTHFGKFKCKKCSLVTYYRSVMEKHYALHAGVRIPCKHCDQTFKYTQGYKIHLRNYHNIEYVCVTCAQTFVSDKALLMHRNKYHKTKSTTDSDATAHCEPCGLTFANEQVYIVHIKNSCKHKLLARTIIGCKVCGIKFDNTEDLREHKQLQHLLNDSIKVPCNRSSKKKEKSCSICGVMSKKLSLHIAEKHPDSTEAQDFARRRQHMCDTCGKLYTTKYALLDHVNLHKGVKPYPCKACPARFPSLVKLNVHAARHAPPRHACTHCDKKFHSASNLNNHTRGHIQDRRYKCSICHKGFIHASSLRIHIRGVHHNERRIRKRDTPIREA